MDANFWLYLFCIALVLIGLAGILLPLLPGLPLVFAGLLLAAWTDGFSRVGFWTLALLAGLTLLSLLLDFWATAHGAKRAGGSGRAVLGASLGLLAGVFFGLPGLLLGPFLGALIGELSLGTPWQQATGVGAATWLGLLLGMALKLALAIAMLAIFVIDWVWN
jgi:hypothetical protein